VFENVFSAAPRNLQITPRQSTYQPGDRIQCSAEGNPEPSYQWTDWVNGTTIQGAVLDISENMVDKCYALKCVATNHYNGTTHENSVSAIFCVARGDLLVIQTFLRFVRHLYAQSPDYIYFNV